MDTAKALKIDTMRKSADDAHVYLLVSHDAEQSHYSKRLIKPFSSLELAVDYLRNHLSRTNWDSKIEGFSVIERMRVPPYSVRKVFCTSDDDGDHETVAWWDKSSTVPSFFKVNLTDVGGPVNYIMIGSINGDDDATSFNVDVTRIKDHFDDVNEMRASLGPMGLKAVEPVSVNQAFKYGLI